MYTWLLKYVLIFISDLIRVKTPEFHLLCMVIYVHKILWSHPFRTVVSFTLWEIFHSVNDNIKLESFVFGEILADAICMFFEDSSHSTSWRWVHHVICKVKDYTVLPLSFCQVYTFLSKISERGQFLKGNTVITL